MRKEISPELFNYNKYPGPEFRLVGNQVLAEQLTFELVENQMMPLMRRSLVSVFQRF